MSYTATPDRSMEDRRRPLGVCPQCHEDYRECRASNCKIGTAICGCPARFMHEEAEISLHLACIPGHVTRLERYERFYLDTVDSLRRRMRQRVVGE